VLALDLGGGRGAVPEHGGGFGHLGNGTPTTSKIQGKHPRQSSQNVYSMFDSAQVRQFKEAFSLIDQDSDGLITSADLTAMLTSLGQPPNQSLMNQLLSFSPRGGSSLNPNESPAAGKGINFTMFLTMMGEHLLELDPPDEMLEAFACFDETDDGTIRTKELRYWLGEVGDKMTEEEIDRLLSPPFTDRQSTLFSYREFVKQLSVMDADEEAKKAAF